MEFVASLSQGRTAAAQCGLFTYESVPVIFEPACIFHICVGYERDFETRNSYKILDYKPSGKL